MDNTSGERRNSFEVAAAGGKDAIDMHTLDVDDNEDQD